MKRNKLPERCGFVYIANHRTREIHRVSHLHVNCRVKAMRNAGYCTWLWGMALMTFGGYNGCRWCYKGRDRG